MCVIKKINREATIQAIIDKCNSGTSVSIKDINEFNKKVLEKDDEFLLTAASFCGVEIIYE